MYEQQFPDVDDVVMVKVSRITETGVYADLLEYDVEGLMVLSEISNRRLRNIRSQIHIGKTFVAMVLRVDEDKGYVDISKKRVTLEDREKCKEYYHASKTVDDILRHVCMKSEIDLKSAYQSFGWHMYREYPHALDALKEIVVNPEGFFTIFDVSTNLKKYLIEECCRRLTRKIETLGADIEVTCFKYDGIESIKKALCVGTKLSADDLQVYILYQGAPLYSVRTKTSLLEIGADRIEAACETIQEKIVELGGVFSIMRKVHIVSEWTCVNCKVRTDYDHCPLCGTVRSSR